MIETFSLLLNQVSIMLVLMIIGYILTKKEMIDWIFQMEQSLHKIYFMFPKISDDDTKQLYSSFHQLVTAVVLEHDILEKKNNFVATISKYMCVYNKLIYDALKLY